jgi:hypothetical protein
MLGWIFMCGLVACSSSNVSVTIAPTTTVEPAVAMPSPAPTMRLTSSPDVAPDIVIDTLPSNQVTTLEVGHVLKIEPPNPDIEWQVSFDPDLLELLTPPDAVRMPGQTGWLFRALAGGDGQIVLTSIVSCSNPPCPLMPMRFQVEIRVK